MSRMYFVAKFKINDACCSKTLINSKVPFKVKTIETIRKMRDRSEMKAKFFCLVK